MRFEFSKIILCGLFILLSSNIYGQKEHHFTISLGLLKSTYSLSELARDDERGVGDNDLKFVVTVINSDKKDYNFGSHLRFSYKRYKDADYYLEVFDKNNKVVEFPDIHIGWLVDDEDFYKKNTNKIADTVSGLYGLAHLKKGKYKIRVAYDPANSYFDPNNPHAVFSQKPIYSNWETIEIIK